MENNESMELDVNDVLTHYKAIADDLTYQLVMERAKNAMLERSITQLQAEKQERGVV